MEKLTLTEIKKLKSLMLTYVASKERRGDELSARNYSVNSLEIIVNDIHLILIFNTDKLTKWEILAIDSQAKTHLCVTSEKAKKIIEKYLTN